MYLTERQYNGIRKKKSFDVRPSVPFNSNSIRVSLVLRVTGPKSHRENPGFQENPGFLSENLGFLENPGFLKKT